MMGSEATGLYLSCSRKISTLGEIVDCHDFYLVDLVGVIHDGLEAFPESVHAIRKLQETSGKTVLFLSNMPRPGSISEQKLVGMGLHPDTRVFTSGDLVRHYLKFRYGDRKIYHLGGERNSDILDGIPVCLVEKPDDADVVLLSQFIEQDEDQSQFDSILQVIAEMKLPVMCANPDKIAFYGKGRIRYCAGTFAERIQKMGGCVEFYGKPDQRIYQFIREIYADSWPSSNERVLMIGDTLETDVAGAIASKIQSLLVMTGITASRVHHTNGSTETFLDDFYHFHGIKPDYYMEKLNYS